MILQTKFHGEIQYDKNDILTFPKGILGFENVKEYIIFPLKDNEVFNVLHSVNYEDIGFIIVSPFDICKDYEFELSEGQTVELNIKNPEEAIVYSVVTLNNNVKKITANLRAPIIINFHKKLGQQIVLNDDRYMIKTPIIEENI